MSENSQPYDHKKQGDRRDYSEVLAALSDIKNDLSNRLTRIETCQELQRGRCDAHSRDILAAKCSITNIERAIEFKGADDEAPIAKRTGVLETDCQVQKSYVGWIYTGLCLAWSAILGLGGWIYVHATSNAEPLQHGAEAIKRMKGGG